MYVCICDKSTSTDGTAVQIANDKCVKEVVTAVRITASTAAKGSSLNSCANNAAVERKMSVHLSTS